MDSFPIKVLIIEESPTNAKNLISIIESDPLLKVIGCISHKQKVLDFIELNAPDVLIMDVSTPNLNGFDETRKIMQNHPLPIIIVSEGYDKNDINQSFKALSAGALEILEKPLQPSDPHFAPLAALLIQSLKSIARIRLVPRSYSPTSVQPILNSKVQAKQAIEAIAIGSSIGGPQALRKIFSDLPANFPVPIFVVQHISDGFTQGLADWLQEATALKIKVAKDHEKPLAGTVYLAPDHYHLELTKNKLIRLSNIAIKSGLMPSVSNLFRSVANCYGSQSIGVILTGMGNDGVQELLLMKNAGAWTIAQDQATSLIFGMPKSAIAIQAVKQILPLDQIATALKTLTKP